MQKQKVLNTTVKETPIECLPDNSNTEKDSIYKKQNHRKNKKNHKEKQTEQVNKQTKTIAVQKMRRE